MLLLPRSSSGFAASSLACREHGHAASVQGPIASDLAALEAIWGMYLRNNITHPVCLGGAAPKLACLCCLQIVLCALHGEMKKLEGKVFSSVSKAPRDFHQTEVESLVWLVLKPTRSYWHRSESKDQRHCYVSVDATFYGNWSSSKTATLPLCHVCVK